jgi:hypothetical protein
VGNRQSHEGWLELRTAVYVSCREIGAEITYLPTVLLHAVGKGEESKFMEFAGWTSAEHERPIGSRSRRLQHREQALFDKHGG